MATKQETKYQTRDTVWTEEERAAMQASARERKAASRRSPAEERAEGLQDLQDSIAKMPADDRAMAERIHAIVTAAVPSLVPKTYYGMPAYARDGKDGKVICFFKPKSKFKVRYSTFGFQPDAQPRRGRDVADRVRRDRADAGGRGADRRARQEGLGLSPGRRSVRPGAFGAIDVATCRHGAPGVLWTRGNDKRSACLVRGAGRTCSS